MCISEFCSFLVQAIAIVLEYIENTAPLLIPVASKQEYQDGHCIVPSFPPLRHMGKGSTTRYECRWLSLSLVVYALFLSTYARSQAFPSGRDEAIICGRQSKGPEESVKLVLERLYMFFAS